MGWSAARLGRTGLCRSWQAASADRWRHGRARAPPPPLGDASDPGEVRGPVRLQLSYVDNGSGVRRVDDQPAAEVDADVAWRLHGSVRAGDEHQIPGPQLAQV